MINGLFPFSRGTVMLDALPVAMLVIVPVLAFSLYQVRMKRRFQLHQRLQTTLAAVLLVAIVLFEIDIRLHGWRQLAAPSPYYASWLFPFLYLHLCFAVSATVLWIYMVASVWRQRPVPGSSHAATLRHKRIGRITAVLTLVTAVTGCTFYWMAFIAS